MSVCVLACLASAATQAKKKSTKKKTHTVAATTSKSATPATSKTIPTKSRTSTKNAKGKKTTRRASTPRQLAPTRERYQQIQQALAGKGYFSGEPTGQWGTDSVEALKRFQADQNLTPDGKITSLSLIALGLGPKRLSAQSAPQPAQGVQPR